MRASRWFRSIVALAFLASQTIGVVHATQHELAGGNASTCDMCAVGHGAGAPPAAMAAPVLPVVTAVRVPHLPAPRALTRSHDHPPSRGPPSLP